MALPNLNALRVFEVAARLGSFTRAARELGVTQSAVSKQVAALEAQLGQALFTRGHRQIALTPYGAQVARAAGDSLRDLGSRLSAIEADVPRQIRVVADADFAHLWLFPRLPGFERRDRAIRVRLHSRIALDHVPDGPFDCAVIWGRGNWTGCRFRPLLTNAVFPVAAPGYFPAGAAPAILSDLSASELIHDQSTFWWSAFHAAAGAEGFDERAGRIYNQTALCLEAAARGDGVTVGDEVTTARHLRDGRLTCPFPDRMPSPDSYYVVTPAGRAPRPEIAEFTAWLESEAAAHRRWFDAFWRRGGHPGTE